MSDRHYITNKEGPYHAIVSLDTSISEYTPPLVRRCLLGRLFEPHAWLLGDEFGQVEITDWLTSTPYELGVTLVVGDAPFPPLVDGEIYFRRYPLPGHPYEMWAGYVRRTGMWYVRHDLGLHW